ncbi:MAG TPA: hypothetical protein VM659_24840 [Dongiaceae bacterium]|nr:hypothetical protein [Dongiaceae bacterium]
MTASSDTAVWHLRWSHGEAEMQSLGGMLGPVSFTLPDGRQFQPLQVAPWATEPQSAALPGILRRLRGEWPCVPFGRDDRPDDLPADWTAAAPAGGGVVWAHGYGAHHHWQLIAQGEDFIRVAIDYPAAEPVARLERLIRVDADQPALNITLTIIARRSITLPVALHPTFRLPQRPGSVTLEAIDFDQPIAYPVPAEPGISHLTPGAMPDDLAAMPGKTGNVDLTRLPLDLVTEELLQLKNCRGPIVLHYAEEDAHVSLDWDRQMLPDVMLWLSNGGRTAEPWRGRHYALGIEPVNGPFDLGQVAIPPASHPLAERRGVTLSPDQPCVIRSRLAVW